MIQLLYIVSIQIIIIKKNTPSRVLKFQVTHIKISHNYNRPPCTYGLHSISKYYDHKTSNSERQRQNTTSDLFQF